MTSITLEKKISSSNNWGLVALMHEGLIKSFQESSKAAKENNFDELNLLVNKSREILTELLITIGEKDELSTNIRSLYLYTNKLITEGEIKRESSFFHEAIDVISPIYTGFKALEKKEAPNIVAGLTYGKENLEEYNSKSHRTFQG